MKVYYKDIGPLLKKRMKDKGLTNKDLIKRCKIPSTTLKKFFKGEAYKGYMEILEKLSIPLDLSILEIYFFKHPEDNDNNNYTSHSESKQNNKKDSEKIVIAKTYPDRFLPENKKLYEKLIRKNEEDILRIESAKKNK